MSTAFTDSGAPATLASKQQPPAALFARHPALTGLLIGLLLILTSTLFGLLFTSAVYGYPIGVIA